MNIGEFRDRVAVKRLTKSADGFGGSHHHNQLLQPFGQN